VLHSLKAITKETPTVTRRLGRASPHPGFGSQIELSGRDTGSLFNLLGGGLALSSQRITPEEAPPALLQVQPAGPGGDEDVLDAWMPFQPGARLQAGMTGEVIGDDQDVTRRMVGFDVGQQSNGALGVTRSGTAGHLLAIAHA
jgi:hypothetical protein